MVASPSNAYAPASLMSAMPASSLAGMQQPAPMSSMASLQAGAPSPVSSSPPPTLVPPYAPEQGAFSPALPSAAQASLQKDSFSSPASTSHAGDPSATGLDPAKVVFAPPSKGSILKQVLGTPATGAAAMGAVAALAGATLATGLHAVKANTLTTGAVLYALIGLPLGWMVGKINQANSRFQV